VTCSDRCATRRRASTPFARFRRAVKWPHDLAWLAGKLGLPEDDPRLPKIALKLANAGHLCVYIGVDGAVSSVGKPKEVVRTKEEER
jgi:hypothetical protein